MGDVNRIEREKYCLKVSRTPSGVADELLRYTQEHVARSTMLIGPMVGTFLGWMVEAIRAKRVLEIGCFTGYSALCMAERLPNDGQVITLDINRETVAIGEKFWDRSPHGRKIRPMIAPASESLKRIEGNFDLIFIDADKEGYSQYALWGLERLNDGGVMILDNCLWDDQVWDDSIQDPETVALRAVARELHSREDLTTCLLPVRDGLLCVTRRVK